MQHFYGEKRCKITTKGAYLKAIMTDLSQMIHL